VRALGHVICGLHDALPKLFGLISKDLGLPTDELTLKLSEFLRFPHANHPLGEVERVQERFFRKEHGAVANTSRLLIHALRRRPGDRLSRAALLWLRFCSATSRIQFMP
jgi:hypothetical protein